MKIKSIKNLLKVFIGLTFSCLISIDAFACPKINGLADYNCDRHCKITVTGDSIARGIGDITQAPGEDILGQGYVGRLETSFPKCKVWNLGVPGITTEKLIRAFKNRLEADGDNITKQKTYNADYFIIDEGRNDFWEKNNNPVKSATNIRRLIKYLKAKYAKNNMEAPFFMVPKLLKTTRAFQQPFIDKLNQAISFLALPSGPDLSRIQPSYTISEDGIHPTATGYDNIAKAVIRYIKKNAQLVIKSKLLDNDKDGVYDKYEVKKFSTSPQKIDTDEDGVSDLTEIFNFKSDPLNPLSFEPYREVTPTPTSTPVVVETSTPTHEPTITPTATATPTP